MNRFSRAILLAICVIWPCTASAQLRHYIFFNRDRERISEASFLETKAIEGAQIKYTWRQLEPRKGEYDFTAIREDLAFLSAKGKGLFIQIQDASFDVNILPFPRYLLDEPQYNGGADRQFAIPDDDETRAVPAGWVARRWDPAVRARFHALLAALGKEFDGKIEGINLPETAVDFGESGRLFPKGFTVDAYTDGIESNMAALKQAFPKSVAMQYANFMFEKAGAEEPANLRRVYQRGADLGVAMGGPDLLPYRPWQMKHSYPLLREFSDRIPTGIAVQDGNYGDVHPRTKKPITLDELFDFAEEFLKVDYVFWCTEEPYYSQQVLPRLQKAGPAR